MNKLFSAEQQARDMLERAGVEDAQNMTSGDLVEIANLIAGNIKIAIQDYERSSITDKDLNDMLDRHRAAQADANDNLLIQDAARSALVGGLLIEPAPNYGNCASCTYLNYFNDRDCDDAFYTRCVAPIPIWVETRYAIVRDSNDDGMDEEDGYGCAMHKRKDTDVR